MRTNQDLAVKWLDLRVETKFLKPGKEAIA
jgi:hypothetical protein